MRPSSLALAVFLASFYAAGCTLGSSASATATAAASAAAAAEDERGPIVTIGKVG